MENGLNLRKHENEGIPEDVLKKVCESFPGPWGAAFMQDGVMEVVGSKVPNYDDIQNFQTEQLGKHVFFSFTQSGPEQPFMLITQEGVAVDTTGKEERVDLPVCVAFIEGEFNGKKVDEVAEAYLAKKLQRIYDFNEQDIDKFCIEMREESTKTELLAQIGERGVIELFCENGEVISFPKGLSPGSFQWGYMSNHLGFMEKKEEPKVEEPAKPESSVRRVVRRIVGSVPATSMVNVPPKTDTAVPGDALIKPAAQQKADTKVEDAAKPIKLVKWVPNPKWTETKFKDKYKKLGFKLEELPGWKQGISVYVEKDRILNLRDELGGTMYEDVPAGAVRGPVLSGAAAEKANTGEGLKDTKPEHVPATAAKPVSAEILPILSPEQRKVTKDFQYLKTIDKNSEDISDPSAWLEKQKNHVALAEQLGLPKDTLFRLKFEGVQDLATKHPKAAAILFVDMRIKAVEQENLVRQLTARIAELEKASAPSSEPVAEPAKATGTSGAPARRVIRR